ncbi:MAG: putative pre-16S rRNA nuclease [Chlamydiia bacterium]|nr:putative pre-16S rRNA nuclease [Chlamydiia bacterium]
MNIKDEFIVAIDFGLKRTGLAICSKGLTMALPSKTIDTHKSDDNTIKTIQALYPEEIDRFILGHPLFLDGTKSNMTKRVEAFGEVLKNTTQKPVHLIDERLTSEASEDLLKDLGHARKERFAMKDSLSAQLILKDFLQEFSTF